MSEKLESRNLGRKTWYIIAIILSGLILLISVSGIVGSWIIQDRLSDVTITLLETVDRTAGGIRTVLAEVDQPLGQMQEITQEIASTSDKISQSVGDQGLILTLLPEEQADKLVELAGSIQETLNTIEDIATSIISLYRSINNLPFVTLPSPSEDAVNSLEKSISDIKSSVDQLRQEITNFRTEAAGKIDQFTQAADQVATSIENTRDQLDQLDSDLARVQDTSQRLQNIVPTVFALSATFSTLLLAYVGYTQVEMIRLYRNRWRELGSGSTEAELAAEAPQVESVESPTLIEDEDPGSPAEEE